MFSKSPAVAGFFVSPHLSLHSIMMKKILFITLLLSVGFCQNNNRILNELIDASNQVNEMCPAMLDDETRMDITYIINDDTFIYNYTLINYEKENFKEPDILAMTMYMKNSITDFWKNDPEFVFYRINKINIIYKYKDKYGNHLFEFSFNAGNL